SHCPKATFRPGQSGIAQTRIGLALGPGNGRAWTAVPMMTSDLPYLTYASFTLKHESGRSRHRPKNPAPCHQTKPKKQIFFAIDLYANFPFCQPANRTDQSPI